MASRPDSRQLLVFTTDEVTQMLSVGPCITSHHNTFILALSLLRASAHLAAFLPGVFVTHSLPPLLVPPQHVLLS